LHFLASSSDALSTPHLPLDEEAKINFEKLNKIGIDNARNNEPRAFAADSIYEYEVASYFEYQSGICGATKQSYQPIVGGGSNGAILHYIENDQPLIDGSVLLIDAGSEFWGYGSDITRTYPVNGKFTEDQRVVYNIVLRTQSDVAAVTKAGVSWTTLNTIARNSITRYLLETGFLQGSLDTLLSQSLYNVFYPHSIGHSLGLDVHDSQASIIEANSFITIEPGVYFNNYLLDEAKKSTRSQYINWTKVDSYRNFGGVRIEDDYIVTSTGYIKVTTVPSDIDEIEKIMSSANI